MNDLSFFFFFFTVHLEKSFAKFYNFQPTKKMFTNSYVTSLKLGNHLILTMS